MAVTFRIEHADGQVDWVPVTADGDVTLGRDLQNHVVLKAPEVSRRHLTVGRDGHRFLVTDSSANGTRIGSLRLKGTTAPVDEGTPMSVGNFSVRLFLPERTPDEVDEWIRARPAAPAGTAAPRAPAKPDHPTAPVADVPVPVRKRMHALLLENMDLAELDRVQMAPDAMQPKVRAALRRIASQMADEIPAGADVAQLIDEICDEALGLGPLEELIKDPSVSEIMVVDPATIYVERDGRISETSRRFTDAESVRAIIERIVTPLGRRIDESTPVVDARLPDGSRVHAIIPPLAVRGPAITIRKFAAEPFTMDALIAGDALTPAMARFLERCVKARKNILVSGGTGSGKTTLLNVLSAAIPREERIITIEDAAELSLAQPHVVSLESRRANVEGRGEYPIRELVRNALRMRPDRIVVGEVRSGEALDMLQAMNTGHQGSMTTTHANSPAEALDRLETLTLMGGLEISVSAARKQIAGGIDIIVQTERSTSDGSRRVTHITEVVGLGDDAVYEQHDIFAFEQTDTGPRGEILGEFRQTGYLPSFLSRFIALGLIRPGEDYL
jgi:pilus assembly protein CpaF